MIPTDCGWTKVYFKITFKISQDFNLQFQDQDFDGQFFTLLKMNDIEDKDTIQVFFSSQLLTLMLANSFDASSVKENTDCISTEMLNAASSCSSSQSSDDTIILSSPETILRSSPERRLFLRSSSWPAQFVIPTFSFDIEFILQAANEAYRKDGTCLTNYLVKPNILDKLADSVFSYSANPSRALRGQVAETPMFEGPSVSKWYVWMAEQLEIQNRKLSSKSETPGFAWTECKLPEENCNYSTTTILKKSWEIRVKLSPFSSSRGKQCEPWKGESRAALWF